MTMSKVRRPAYLRLADRRVIGFPAVMGILNITPDSFRDSGRFFDHGIAAAHAEEMVAAGADIVDVGGESTRPGAHDVPVDEELRRVIPVVRMLAKRIRAPISVDTRKAAVARAALGEGAAIINDVSALTFDTVMAETVAAARAAMVLMHMRGTPATMSGRAHYRDVVGEVRRYLAARIRVAIGAGIARSRLIIDPGFGFAKRPEHNLALLRGLPRLAALGYPVLVGFSGKALSIGMKGSGERERIARNAAAEAIAVLSGAAILRVHDPAPAVAAIRTAAAFAAGPRRT